MTEDDFSLESYERSDSFWDEFCMLLLPWENKLRIQFEKQQKLPRVPQGHNLPEDATYLLLKGEHREGFKGLRLQEEEKIYQVSVHWNQEGCRGGKKTNSPLIYNFFFSSSSFSKDRTTWMETRVKDRLKRRAIVLVWIEKFCSYKPINVKRLLHWRRLKSWKGCCVLQLNSFFFIPLFLRLWKIFINRQKSN